VVFYRVNFEDPRGSFPAFNPETPMSATSSFAGPQRVANTASSTRYGKFAERMSIRPGGALNDRNSPLTICFAPVAKTTIPGLAQELSVG